MDHLIRNFLMVILFACYVSADDLKCDFDKSSCSFLSNDPENFENWKFGRGQLNSAGEGPSVDHTIGTGHQSVCTFDESSCGYNALYTGPLAWKRKDQEKTGFLLSILPRVDHTLGTSSGGYWFVGVRGSDVSSLDTAVLESKTYTIRNREPLSCLKFYFYMDADGTAWFERKVDEAYLQVHIADHLSRTLLVTKAKNTTRHRIWSYVEVEVENRESFKITFTAGLKSSVEALIAIDDVRFDVGTCPETGSCDFEEDKCAWVDGEGDYTWVRKSGKSLLEDEIGPSSDKTLGTRDGYYVVISTEKEQPVKLANLESELFRATNNSLCLNFYYYSYGWDVGTLLVVRKDENGTESIVWRLQDSTTEYRWMKGTVSLNPRSSETRFQAVFRAILGSPGFFAIDDIRVRAGETHCHTSPSRADPAFTAWVNDRVFPNGGERKSEEDY
ncbi:MAM and LDL-receptor class A domain-containing protein 1-like isoform X4 [Stegodyphus dumicola]|uniref:MAM and LDL-receptor class A domain-containing protein 1-like isoform X4 n=1 Tax=Stegodyphus dumicola TaxID=202533 RepID=UPI0015AE1FB9|nr:MAM and LDL-receptor class A domain-containing protein 1-like isoform X4 [Stegodyphus dumicola]